MEVPPGALFPHASPPSIRHWEQQGFFGGGYFKVAKKSSTNLFEDGLSDFSRNCSVAPPSSGAQGTCRTYHTLGALLNMNHCYTIVFLHFLWPRIPCLLIETATNPLNS